VTGDVFASHVYGRYVDEVLSMRRDTDAVFEDYFHLVVHQFNVIRVTDAAGAIVESCRYGAVWINAPLWGMASRWYAAGAAGHTANVFINRASFSPQAFGWGKSLPCCSAGVRRIVELHNSIREMSMFWKRRPYKIHFRPLVDMEYIEGGKRLRPDCEGQGMNEIAVAKASIARWEPPHENEPLSEEDKKRIMSNIEAHFGRWGTKIQWY
jgi:hypothetical protein